MNRNLSLPKKRLLRILLFIAIFLFNDLYAQTEITDPNHFIPNYNYPIYFSDVIFRGHNYCLDSIKFLDFNMPSSKNYKKDLKDQSKVFRSGLDTFRIPDIDSLCRRLLNVESVRLYNNSGQYESAILELKRLKSIELYNTNEIPAFLENIDSLEYLEVTHVKLKKTIFGNRSEKSLEGLTRVKELNVHLFFPPVLLTIPNVEKLTMTSLYDDIPNLGQYSRLNQLHLSLFNYSGLFKSIVECSNLEYLRIYHDYSLSVEELIELSSHPAIKSFDLYYFGSEQLSCEDLKYVYNSFTSKGIEIRVFLLLREKIKINNSHTRFETHEIQISFD